MAKFFVLLALALASVQGSNVNRVGGWGPPAPPPTTPPPPPPTTPGWSPPETTTAPPPPPTTTPGWSPPPETAPPLPPATTPGWSAPPPPPPPSGWVPPPPPPPSSVTVDLAAALAVEGSGVAAESHAENIAVTGGWGVPADLLVSSGGESVVAQEGSILQVTSVDADSATAINSVSAGQVAAADEGLAVIASGLDVLVGQSGWAGAAGEGASAAAAETSLIVSRSR